MDEVIVNGMPDSLRRYITEECSIPAAAFTIMPGEKLPEPEQKLLFHPNDMTSTLEQYLKSELYVERIQNLETEDVYLREVFLRTRDSDAVVEYGVIAIVLKSFTKDQHPVIHADYEPLGGLLHQFKIDFESTPVCFFSILAEYLVNTPFKELAGHVFYGRFNQLTKANGQKLAWIMEILPESHDI